MSLNKSLTLLRITQLLIFIFPVCILVDLASGFCTVQLGTYIPVAQLFRVIIMAAITYLLSVRAKPLVIWMILIQILFFILASSFWLIIV